MSNNNTHNDETNNNNVGRLNDMMNRQNNSSTTTPSSSGGSHRQSSRRSVTSRESRSSRGGGSTTPRRHASRSNSDDKSIASQSSSNTNNNTSKRHSSTRKPSSSRSTTTGTRRSDSKDATGFAELSIDTAFATDFAATFPTTTTAMTPTPRSQFTNTATSPIVHPPAPPLSTKNSGAALLAFAPTPRPLWIADTKTSTKGVLPMPTPQANPLTGRLMMVVVDNNGKGKNQQHNLVEWNPHTRGVVHSMPLLSPSFSSKLLTKYPAIGHVSKILQVSHIAVGLSSNLKTKVVLLMTVEVVLQESSTWTKQSLTVLATYGWNLNNHTGNSQFAKLESLLSPPSGGDFTYDASTLCVSDQCLFVAGYSAAKKSACVFLSKLTTSAAKETWSANFLKTSSAPITSLATLSTSIQIKENPKKGVPSSSTSNNNNSNSYPRLPYLAVGLSNGDVSIWTYEAALKSSSKSSASSSDNSGGARRLLYPYCQLDTLQIVQEYPVNKDWSNDGGSSSSAMDEQDTSSTTTESTLGAVAALEWTAPRMSAYNQLLMVAATFEGGAVGLYHIALPKLLDASTKKYTPPKPPTERTVLTSTPLLPPMGAYRWGSRTTMPNTAPPTVAFVDLGPHLPTPSLAVLIPGVGTTTGGGGGGGPLAQLALLSYETPIFGLSSSKSSGSGKPLLVWGCTELLSSTATTVLPSTLLPASSCRDGLLYATPQGHIAVVPLQCSNPQRIVRGGLGSTPPGLTTSGTIWSDTANSTGSVWHVYSTLHAERKKSAHSLDWAAPSRRHWLVETYIGDTKEASAVALPGNEDDVVLGGTTTKLVCELGGGLSGAPLSKLFPMRVVKGPSNMGAVIFASVHPQQQGEDKTSRIAILENDSEKGTTAISQIMEGKDASFWGVSSSLHLLVLGRNGGTLTVWHRGSDGTWVDDDSLSFRPIVGVNETSSEDYVHCERLVVCPFLDQASLLAVGVQDSTDLSCLVIGPLAALSNIVDFPAMLPKLSRKDCVYWLEAGERVASILCLPAEQTTRGAIVVATSHRLLIFEAADSSLTVRSSVKLKSPPTSIVPLGSFSVAYASQDDHKIRYLSGVPGAFGASGLIASLPAPQYDYNPYWILAVRPDRIVYSHWHAGTRLVERGQDSHVFLIPAAITRPALLLEPMLANAIATGGDQVASQPFLRTIIEKFGRKVATMTHGEEEGIGNHGAGMTPRVFELLEYYNLQAAASWLLTGTTRFERSSNSRLLPSWMPVSVKVKGAFNSDTHLHAIANGDQYFSEYIKSPDNNMTATLPRPSDPSSTLCQAFAIEYLKNGKTLDAFKLLDLVGTESSDAAMLQLSLAMQGVGSKDMSPIVQSLYQSDAQAGNMHAPSSVSSLAALAIELKKTGGATTNGEFTKQWMRPLAPSLQRGRKIGRNRPRIMGESTFHVIQRSEPLQDRMFSSEIPESKLVWNEGPNREKENLLMLDNIQDWFGRRRPVILGKEGVKSAEDRGASTLADILAQKDDDSFGGGDNHDDVEEGWTDGVGEGQKDEDKLSAYFRFSEGEDEDDSAWRDEGFSDLSKYELKAVLVGCKDSATLAESTSSVDEGDPGKVKAIFDLIFSESGVGEAQALAFPASRGGCIDVGLMHGPEHPARQKLSLEFWFWVPEDVSTSVVLARRSFGSSADDLDTVCRARNKSCALWELLMTPTGEVEFRTVSGASISSSPKPPGEDDDGPQSTLNFGRWNHICLIMKQESTMKSKVNLLVKGDSVCEKMLDFKPPHFEEDDFDGASALDSLLEKSHLLFALDHPANFRMTELRVWATERDDDDVRTMMTEYLEAAESKRKFRVKIKKKGGNEGGGKITFGAPKGLLAPKGGLIPPKAGGLTPPRALAPPKGALAPPPGEEKSPPKGLLAPPKGSEIPEKLGSPSNEPNFGFGTETGASPALGGDGFGSFGTPTAEASHIGTAFASGFGDAGVMGSFDTAGDEYGDEDMIEISPLWDSAIPLSEQVRSSAAAALIRGPPATRHFGGNRGGLPDYREMERMGVGAISICGSEKTIVWRDDQVPPGLTYPIGASGAIVSDQMDEEGSEFLCCFLAKEKRMVVFELSTRTVVVELQMTTKLNYWRFLPPEAGEDTLCFMLVTPVGGFHWQALDESPRPRQVWKRGPELQSKKIVCYEEGGTNGMDGPDIISKVGMLLVTSNNTDKEGGALEAWVVPICGDSQAICASDDVLGACLCQPPQVGLEPWMPLLLFVVESEERDLVVCVSAVMETSSASSIGLTDVMTDALIEMGPYHDIPPYEAPTLAMGSWPEILCCSLGSTIVVIVRRKGLVVAYELADTGLELIAQEHVGQFVVDAVMRYSAVEGGAEIVLLMSDSENPRDGRVGTFCFRTAG